MGKSKKRILNKSNETLKPLLKRKTVINNIIKDIKNNNLREDTKNFISLFGIKFEELSEAGVSYEELSAVKHLIF